MRSATSYFKVSAAVIKDDFRRFWAIPVIGFIYYFFSSVFVILMKMREASVDEYGGNFLANFVSDLLTGRNLFNIVNILWMSVLSVLLVFRYLHNSGHVIAVHSQPFTRATLLNSHTVSCILFIALPIILTGIILLVIAHPVYYSSMYYSSSEEMVDLFARANVLRWMWESFLMAMFVMVISIAAGMVTGTSFHHAVAALGFNGVAPLCTMLLSFYFETYLFGYVTPDWIGNVIEHMSPVINVAVDGSFLSIGENALYIVLVVLIYALSMFLYSKRKLERATDGIVFKAVDVLVTLIFGYLGMTGLGLALYSMFDQSKGAATLGYIVGAVLGIIIVRMVIMKTVRVFNKKTLIIMGGYLVMALVFFACLNFNITGYETRVDEDADAIDVSLSNSYDLTMSGGRFEDADAKAALCDLHKLIIENKSLIKEVNDFNNEDGYGDSGSYEDIMYISFSYLHKDGKDYATDERRVYNVPTYLVLNSEPMKALADSGAFVEKALEKLPEAGKVQYIDIQPGSFHSDGASYGVENADGKIDDVICSDKAQISGLMAAIEKDINEMTYDEIKNSYNMPCVAWLDITYAVDDNSNKNALSDEQQAAEQMISAARTQQREGSLSVRTSDISVALNASYKNAIAWLNANGYASIVQYDPSYWNFAVVYDVENGRVTADGASDDYSMTDMPQSSDGIKVVTDPSNIQVLYENVSSHVAIGALSDMNTSENNVYMVKFYHRGSESSDYYSEFSAYIDGSYVK